MQSNWELFFTIDFISNERGLCQMKGDEVLYYFVIFPLNTSFVVERSPINNLALVNKIVPSPKKCYQTNVMILKILQIQLLHSDHV